MADERTRNVTIDVPVKETELKKNIEKVNKVDDKIDQKHVEGLPGDPEQNTSDLSPFDRILTNADLAVQTLLQEERHIVANQISRLVDYCNILRNDLDDKKNEYEELLPQINEAKEGMDQALEVSFTSGGTIRMLKVKLENAWREVDAAHIREQTMQDQMIEMYLKLTIYEGKTKKVQKTDDENMSDIGPLANKKETVLRERNRLQAEVNELEKRLHMQRLYADNLEKRRHETETANSALMQELESTDTNTVKFKRRIQDLELNLNRVKEENWGLNKKLLMMDGRLEEVQKQFELKTTELQLTRSRFDKLKLEHTASNKTLMNRGTALNICRQENRSLSDQVRTAYNKLKSKEFELSESKKDCKKSIANFDLMASKLNKLNNAKTNFEQDITLLRNEITNRKKEAVQYVKAIETERHEKEVGIHERDALRSTIVKMTNAQRELEHSMMLRNTSLERLHEDLIKKNLKFDELKQSFHQIVKERDQNAQEIEVLNDKVDSLIESMSLKSEQIIDLKNSIIEKHATHMKTKQNLESTNSERRLLRQQLQTCTEERDNIKTQFTYVTYQVKQLKEDISTYQNKMLGLNFEIVKLGKEKRELKIETRNTTFALNNVRNELKDTKCVNKQLYNSLSTDERRLMKQAMKLNNTMHEKDVIGSQMIRRNDEIVLLKEQISIREIGLQRGQMQYNQRIEDIKLLKLEIMKLRSQRNLLTRGLANTADVRHEVLQLHRLLLQERVTNQALKEEAVSHMNIHRWRALRGRDPERMELIQKTILLQRRVLRLHVAALSREQELHESHKLYILLKSYIEKLPSFKVKEDLLKSQQAIRIRSKKMKALTAELNSMEIEVQSRDCAIEELNLTLDTAKKELYKIKKRALNEKGNNHILESIPTTPQTRTLGAGFKIKC